MSSTTKAYELAKELYASIGVDTDKAIERLEKIPVSMHCWQGDDVRGFENPDGDLTGGIQTTGNYPGRATTIDELRADFEKAISLIPGKKRMNLHRDLSRRAGRKGRPRPDRAEALRVLGRLGEEDRRHARLQPDLLLSPAERFPASPSRAPTKASAPSRIEHCKRSRIIAAYFGRELGETACTNHSIPDGFKDIPVDRYAWRERLIDSYDKIFAGQGFTKLNLNSVESKVFRNRRRVPAPSAPSKCASATPLRTTSCSPSTPVTSTRPKSSPTRFRPRSLLLPNDVMLHVSRPVRWDSDHVVIFDDELKYISQEIIRGNFEKRVHIGLDFFDASINRIAAWVIGARKHAGNPSCFTPSSSRPKS